MPKDLAKNVVPKEGLQGPAGPTGPQGPPGEGLSSSDVVPGPKGDKGDAASISNDANNRVITAVGDGTVNAESNLIFDGSILTIFGEVSATTLDIDGTDIAATAAEINTCCDGDTVALAMPVALSNTDQIIINNDGIMRQITLADVETWADSNLDTLSNVTSLGTLTSLTVDNIVIDGSTIGHTSDTDLLTLASGLLTVAGEVSATTLDIGGTNITSTADELNVLDAGSALQSGPTLIGTDAVVVNDGGAMKQVLMSAFETFMETNLDTLGNVTSLGTLTSLTVDNIIIDGATIGHTSDTDLITLSSGTATFAGNVTMSGTGDVTLLIEADTDNSGENDNPLLWLRQDGGGINNYFGINGNAGQHFNNSLGNGGFWEASGNIPLQMATNNEARITVLGGGDVGIGTHTPTSTLHVVGDLQTDNININGNTISSTDTNGAINLSPNGTGIVNFADAPVVRPKLKDFSETVNAIGTITDSPHSINFESGNVQSFTLGGNATIVFSNPPATGIAGSMTLIITNGGAHTLTWDTDIQWPGGSAPALTASGVDIISFLTVDAGGDIYGFVGGINFSTP